MTATTEFKLRAVMETACEAVGLTPAGAELLSTSADVTFRLPSSVIVRIARQKEQGSAAAREVRVAKWLEACDIPAVLTVGDIAQPVEIDGRPVTFWHELPPHRQGTWTDVATAVRRLHKLAPPTDFDLGVVPAFVRLADRIEAAHSLTNDERGWMRAHLRELSQTWTDLPAGPEWCVVHGDAWVENVVVAEDGSLILVDLERTSIGPPGTTLCTRRSNIRRSAGSARRSTRRSARPTAPT